MHLYEEIKLISYTLKTVKLGLNVQEHWKLT